MHIGDPDIETRRGLSGDGDVAAQRHHRSTAKLGGDGLGGPIGGQRLGRGSEVEGGPGGKGHGRSHGIDLHGQPTGNRPALRERTEAPVRQLGEIAVIAELAHRFPDSGIDGPPTELGGPKGDRDRLEQVGRHSHRQSALRGPMQTAELRVGTEPTGRRVDPVELPVQDGDGRHHRGRHRYHQIDPGRPGRGPIDGPAARAGVDRHRPSWSCSALAPVLSELEPERRPEEPERSTATGLSARCPVPESTAATWGRSTLLPVEPTDLG